MRTILAIASVLLLSTFATSAFGRSCSLKLVGSGGKGGDNDYVWMQNKSKRLIVELSIGRPGPKESTSPLEIRAASVFKDIRTRKAFINDVATGMVVATNSVTRKIKIVSGSAGKRVDREAKVEGGHDFSKGNTISGVIVEVYQDGKCIKHLSNLPGKDGKTVLNAQTDEWLLNEDEHCDFQRKLRTGQEKSNYKSNGFTNPTRIVSD